MPLWKTLLNRGMACATRGPVDKTASPGSSSSCSFILVAADPAVRLLLVLLVLVLLILPSYVLW